MTAPSVLARNKGASATTNASSFSVPLPAITAGKSLWEAVSAKGNVNLTTASTGWDRVAQANNGTNVTVALFWKKTAAGGDTLTVDSSAVTQFGSAGECVDAGSNAAIFVGPAATGSSTNPNPAAVDTLLARDILFLAVAGHSGTTIDSAAPSGFSNLNAQAGGGSNGAGVSTAEKATTATASQDPGTFTSATSPWVAFTVAIWAAPAWDAAFKAALANLTDDINAMIVGDSMAASWTATTSNGSNYLANAKATAWPSVLANTFTAAPASHQNFWGDGGAGAINGIDGSTTGGGKTDLAAYDHLITLGSGWDGSFQATSSLHTQLTTAGGSLMGSTGSGTSLSFAPTEAFDSFRVYYVAYTGSPNDTVNIGGSSLGTLTQSSRDGLFMDNFTVTRGTHTINVVSGGADGYICGIIPKDSTTPRVNFINAGWYGSSSDDWDWTGTYAEPLKAINMLAPKLTVYALGGNDMLRSLGVDNCLQHSRNIILNGLKYGSVLGFGHPYFDPGQVAEATQLAYTNAVQQACRELGCGWVSMKDQPGYTTYALTLSNGYIGADDIHPNDTGYANMAEVVRLQVDPGRGLILVSCAASSTPGAVLAKAAARSFSATSTSNPAVARRLSTVLIRSASASALLSRQSSRTGAASSTSSAGLAAQRVSLRSALATCTPLSSVSRQVALRLATACAAAAARLSTTSRTQVAATSPAATAARGTAAILLAVTTPVSSLAQRLGRILVSTTSPLASASLGRVFLRVLSATTSALASMAGQRVSLVAGTAATAPAASIRRSSVETLMVSTAPVSLRKVQVSLALGVSVAAGAALGRRVSLTLARSTTPAAGAALLRSGSMLAQAATAPIASVTRRAAVFMTAAAAPAAAASAVMSAVNRFIPAVRALGRGALWIGAGRSSRFEGPGRP